MDNSRLPDLDQSRRDDLVQLVRGLTGAVPLIGPLVGEIVGRLIPAQREDRIVDMLRRLDSRLDDIERQTLISRLSSSAEDRDILEEGISQACRAVNEERRERIAVLLKSTLTLKDLEYYEARRLFALLGQLTDIEILILQSHGLQASPDGANFVKQHENALTGLMPETLGPRERRDKAAVHQSYRLHLAELGLIKPAITPWEQGSMPEFDRKTGLPVSRGYALTPLGGLLLRKLGLTSHI